MMAGYDRHQPLEVWAIPLHRQTRCSLHNNSQFSFSPQPLPYGAVTRTADLSNMPRGEVTLANITCKLPKHHQSYRISPSCILTNRLDQFNHHKSTWLMGYLIGRLLKSRMHGLSNSKHQI